MDSKSVVGSMGSMGSLGLFMGVQDSSATEGTGHNDAHHGYSQGVDDRVGSTHYSQL